MVTIMNWEVLVDEKLGQKRLLDLYDSIQSAFYSHKPVEISTLNIDFYIRGKVYGKKGFNDGNIVTTSSITSWLTVDGDFSMVKTVSGGTYEICLSEASARQSKIFQDMVQAKVRIGAEKSFHEFFDICDEA